MDSADVILEKIANLKEDIGEIKIIVNKTLAEEIASLRSRLDKIESSKVKDNWIIGAVGSLIISLCLYCYNQDMRLRIHNDYEHDEQIKSILKHDREIDADILKLQIKDIKNDTRNS